MKRVLFVSDLAILPANAGNKARVVALMKAVISLGHEVSFLGLGITPQEHELIRAEFGEKVYFIPKIRLKHLKPRSQAMKRWFLDRMYSYRIGEPGVDYWYFRHWDAEIARFASAHSFDVVIAEYVFFSRALLHFGPETLKVVDTHDKFTGRRQRLKARIIGKMVRTLSNENEEAKGLRRADAILAIQKHEAGFFRRLVPKETPVLTVGHIVEVPHEPLPDGPSGTVLFFGTDYIVNVNGLKAFINECVPLIRHAIPNFRLLVAGTICSVYQPQAPDIVLLGRVGDVKEAYAQASVVINPVDAGTGLKTKSIEAMALGRPMVTTACGAEGIEEGAGVAFLQEEVGADFAGAVIRLLKDQSLHARMAEQARQFVREWNDAQIASLGELFKTREIANV
jgi:glycosyltransferase involved in cell wall biosynthesis